MSFLNLKKLLPPRKMWKVFTNKLQIKLHKLNRSKANKKSKFQSYKNSKRNRLGWPSLSIRPKKFKPKPRLPQSLIHLQKTTPPVYVDQLFIEPASASRAKEEPKPENKTAMTSDHEKSNIAAADEMWESMVMASPQTQGINERADEFIARFRNQMHNQELLLARRL
ncbi:hypothetical protein PHJA_000433900 [Phtheirospermum japonicum]|uniref:Uncharacterized protein n=1 Tax=Phtheirospermum japonicum TaxID=374723 RepID=A0A830BCS4_9LAMI|nr:hypothetical protein PHJA_000433900 [Phtheirospermum japonicum]